METTKKLPQSDPTEGTTPARRPYEPPNLAWTHKTELVANVASACARFAGSGEPCNTIPAS